jgi:hypothetical protein
VVSQTGTKEQFYCTPYYITLNSSCEAQYVSKNMKKIKDRVKKPNYLPFPQMEVALKKKYFSITSRTI